MESRENDTPIVNAISPIVSIEDLIENQKKIVQLHQVRILSGKENRGEINEAITMLRLLIEISPKSIVAKQASANSLMGASILSERIGGEAVSTRFSGYGVGGIY